MSRTTRAAAVLLAAVLIAGCGTGSENASAPPPRSAADLGWIIEADVASLQTAMVEGRLTAVELTHYYLNRIETMNTRGPELRAVLETDPAALDHARALDEERAASGVRGPLHGIPVLIKGNIDVAGLQNTAGSLALAGHVPARDAPLVAELRAAGAVILGTANLSEWANFRSTESSSGWSSVGGQVRNPYALDRNPCGSSSGSAVAVAANLTAVAVGTETDGSVVCPAGLNGIVGIKPTLGLVSPDGIVPIAHSQDTAGPMGRTVRDAATLLQAMVGRDPDDAGLAGGRTVDYVAALGDGRLDGVRIGVDRRHFGAGEIPGVEACMTSALSTLEGLGAEIVDPATIPDTEGLDDAELAVLEFEFKTDLAQYLAAHGAPNGMATLADLIAFNEANAEQVMPHFGQELFLSSQERGDLDSPEYLEVLATSKSLAQGAIENALAADTLHALAAPTNSPAWLTDWENGDDFSLSSSTLAAVSGWASVTVPMCQVDGLPVGLSFTGGAFSETTLLRIAYAFEQATQERRAPELLPTLAAR